MTKIIVLLFCVLSVLTQFSYAQYVPFNNDDGAEHSEIKSTEIKSTEIKSAGIEKQLNQSETKVLEKTPEVGKHVMANMDASSMIVSLLMVLALITISAVVLKRFNLTQQGSNQLKVIANLALGAKERIMVVQVGEQQLVLGVCPQQISLLKQLETPIDINEDNKSMALSKNILSFLQKNTIKTENDSNVATNEITNNK